MRHMRMLVCGGRDFGDYEAFSAAMKALHFTPDLIIQGGAKGADSVAVQWAKNHKVHFATVPALWDAHGRSAGPKRNAVMLAMDPDYCLAMPGGRGTADMVRKCEQAGVITWLPYGETLK